MAEYDPLRYLELLDDYTSRETARVRRNVGIVSAVVLATELFDAPLDRLSVASVPILAGHERTALVIAAVLLAYWSTLFLARYRADHGRRAERLRIAADVAAPLQNRLAELERTVSEQPALVGVYNSEIAELKRFFEKYA